MSTEGSTQASRPRVKLCGSRAGLANQTGERSGLRCGAIQGRVLRGADEEYMGRFELLPSLPAVEDAELPALQERWLRRLDTKPAPPPRYALDGFAGRWRCLLALEGKPPAVLTLSLDVVCRRAARTPRPYCSRRAAPLRLLTPCSDPPAPAPPPPPLGAALRIHPAPGPLRLRGAARAGRGQLGRVRRVPALRLGSRLQARHRAQAAPT